MKKNQSYLIFIVEGLAYDIVAVPCFGAELWYQSNLDNTILVYDMLKAGFRILWAWFQDIYNERWVLKLSKAPFIAIWNPQMFLC